MQALIDAIAEQPFALDPFSSLVAQREITVSGTSNSY
jgi:hypothetical protein